MSDRKNDKVEEENNTSPFKVSSKSHRKRKYRESNQDLLEEKEVQKSKRERKEDERWNIGKNGGQNTECGKSSRRKKDSESVGEYQPRQHSNNRSGHSSWAYVTSHRTTIPERRQSDGVNKRQRYRWVCLCERFVSLAFWSEVRRMQCLSDLDLSCVQSVLVRATVTSLLSQSPVRHFRAKKNSSKCGPAAKRKECASPFQCVRTEGQKWSSGAVSPSRGGGDLGTGGSAGRLGQRHNTGIHDDTHISWEMARLLSNMQ